MGAPGDRDDDLEILEGHAGPERLTVSLSHRSRRILLIGLLAVAVTIGFIAVFAWRREAPSGSRTEPTTARRSPSAESGTTGGVSLTAPIVRATTLASTPEAIRQRCGSRDAVRVDVDDDGRPDRVYYGFFTLIDGGRLGVCTASGTTSELHGLGQPEALGIVAVPGRSGAVILHGGTSAYDLILQPAIVDAGRLRPIMLPDGSSPVLESGSDPTDSSHQWMFGCKIFGSDAALVQLEASRLPSGGSGWQRTTYLLRGRSATAITDRGTTDTSDRAALRALAPACNVLASPGYGQTFGQR